MAKRRSWTDEDLTKAVASSRSMRQTLISLGLCGRGGGSYKSVQRYIDELNLDTSHWTRQGYLKGQVHNWNKKIPLKEILIKDSNYQSNHLKKRILKELKWKYECSVCGISEWQNKKLSLQLDHINGISNDHRIFNLRLLCPNCHSQTTTFCRGQKRERTQIGKAGTLKKF